MRATVVVGVLLGLVGLGLGLVGLAQAQGVAPSTCTPTVTTKRNARLTWNPPLPIDGLTIQGYLLQRQSNGGGWQDLPAVPASATSAEDRTLAVGTHLWRLAVQWQLGNGSLVVSDYADYGPHQPCLAIVVAPPATGLQVDPLE